MTTAVGTAPVARPDRGFFGHPRGLATLFATELWERFSYYGMRAILVLFLTAEVSKGGLGWSNGLASGLYAVYVALVYMLPIPGGWLADRVLGPRKATLWGGVIIALGHYTLAIPGEITVYLGLLLVAVGTGLLKPNISAMVGNLYGRDDERRDAGFTVFYLSINIGAFFAPLVCGFLAEEINWHVGFGAAGVGMTLAVLAYLAGWRWLGDVGKEAPRPATPAERRHAFAWGGVAAAALAALLVLDVTVSGGFRIEHVINFFSVLGVALPVAYFAIMFRGVDREYRPKLQAYVWFFVTAVVFWMIYDQSGSLLNLFAEQKTNRDMFGWEFPASWLQSVNPAFIVLLAPLFATLWQRLGARQPSTAVKFAFAMVGIGLSFVVMGAAGAAAGDGRKVAVWWLVGVYFVQTVAELCLSPVGLSVTTKLAPPNFASQMMGLWFLATATANTINGQVTKLNEPLGDTMYYGLLGAVAILGGVAFFLFAGKIRALTGDVR
ncbi:putative peptide transporter [Carbonactinospora thermoautotrophica]|uniref:Putative peptide transporter n=2 Tax=Carbonactinospora thermoautotrophica TaxID=1469144 RepID=A0A132MX67_9ACTN|nr:peptide MFS transporter [Carbonactinospora thermoautotrophica]KWX02417.1 putative peptide transporter [Carbonactinospora thermoautotrophica]